MSLRHQLLWAHLHIEGRDFSVSLVSERSLLGHGDRPHFPAPFPLPNQSPLVSPALATAAVTGASSGTFPPGAAQESRPLVPNDHVLPPHPRPPPPLPQGTCYCRPGGDKVQAPQNNWLHSQELKHPPPKSPQITLISCGKSLDTPQNPGVSAYPNVTCVRPPITPLHPEMPPPNWGRECHSCAAPPLNWRQRQ